MDIAQENLAILIGTNIVEMLRTKYRGTEYEMGFQLKSVPANKERIWLNIYAQKDSKKYCPEKDAIENFNRADILDVFKSFFSPSLSHTKLKELFENYEMNILLSEEDLCTPGWEDLYRKTIGCKLLMSDLVAILMKQKELKSISEYKTIFPYIDFENNKKCREAISYSLLKEILPVNKRENKKIKL